MNIYLTQILWLLAWPTLIIVSYQLIKIMIKKFEKTTFSK
jgi:hypothetical protein